MSGPRTDSRTERVRRRLAGRFVGALIVGPVIGLLIGGLLVAGYSSLESPDPGREPSDTLRPIADRPSLVRDERGDR